MSINIGHVAVGAGILAISSFVYVVGFEPMDEDAFPRAGAMSQTPSRGGLGNQIRGMLAQGQYERADGLVEQLDRHFAEEPNTYFWIAIVDRVRGDEAAERESWAVLDRTMDGIVGASDAAVNGRMMYFRAWGKLGTGDVEEARALFGDAADELDERARRDERGLVVDVGALYNLACYRSMSGEIEVAMGHWERAVELGYSLGGGWWAVDPDLEALRGDDRFWSAASAGSGMGSDRDRGVGADQDDDG